MINKLIENFNLNEKEAKVYLANLELGRSKVSAIAKQAGLNRITTYEIIKRLARRGLAQSLTYSGVQTFKPTEPEQLVTKLERQTQLARAALPELNLLANINNAKPKIQYYEGVEGIRFIYEDALKCKGKILYDVADPKNLLSVIGEEYFKNYVKQRVRRKVKVDIMLPDLPENRVHEIEGKKVLRRVRYIDPKLYPIPNEFYIYDDKVAIFSFTAKFGLIIEDKDIAQSFKSIWQMVWKQRGEN